MIKVNRLPFVEESENLPESDKYLGVSGKGRGQPCTEAQMHKGTDTVLHGQHGKGGMVTLERQGRVREGPPELTPLRFALL